MSAEVEIEEMVSVIKILNEYLEEKKIFFTNGLTRKEAPIPFLSDTKYNFVFLVQTHKLLVILYQNWFYMRMYLIDLFMAQYLYRL